MLPTASDRGEDRGDEVSGRSHQINTYVDKCTLCSTIYLSICSTICSFV